MLGSNEILLKPLNIKKTKPKVYNESNDDSVLLEPKMLPARKEIQPGNLLTHYNGVNCITKPNQYFSILNKFSELDTNEKKLAARRNLGIDGLSYWGNIQGNIEDQQDLVDYIKANIGSTITPEQTKGNGVEVVESLNDLEKVPEIGQLIYVIDEDLIYQCDGETLSPLINRITTSASEPPSKEMLWVDTSGEEIINQTGNLTTLQRQIQTLQNQVNQLMNILNYGAVAGDSTNSTRLNILNSSETINPNGETEEGLIQPTSEGLYPTIPHLSIKMDTQENFVKNRRNLIDGELLWITDSGRLFIYIDNTFKPISSGVAGDITTDDDMTKEDIELLYFNHLGLVDKNNKQYYLQVNDDGNIIVYNSSNYDGEYLGNSLESGAEVGGSYISNYLRINSVFFGGKNTPINSFQGATHNFVELANATNRDINLNGMYLLYNGESTPTYWDALELHGTIKAGSTFLIRGAECSVKTNTNISVDSYDLLWRDSTGKLKEFDSTGGSFYLVVGQNKKIYDRQTNQYVDYDKFPSSVSPYSKDGPVSIGYVDLVGIGTNKIAEGGKSVTTSDKITDCVFFRQYSLDPGSGTVLKAFSKRTSTAFWTYCNMVKSDSHNLPYFTEQLKQRLKPGAVKDNKNFFSNKSKFSETQPNAITLSFGIQATVSNDCGATRCFNWVSVGYYDEYVEYKKQGEANWQKVYSYDGTNSEDPTLNAYKEVYKRFRWVSSNKTAVTTHKVIIRNLSAGTYEYRIGRQGDDSYTSQIKTFTVKSNTNNFKFLHTSDQQGFNYNEYCAWRKAADAIKNDSQYDFVINTGDMTQSGNRESEWLDYCAGRDLLGDVPEMACIGNNDLCGVDLFQLGKGVASIDKINSQTIQLFYNFELDTQNSTYFKYNFGSALDESKLGNVITNDSNSFTYFMPSVYSFNYGDYHFICLNSEFATNPGVYNVYYSDSSIESSFKNSAYYQLYKWMQKDVQLYPNKKYICYHHEIPFNIIKLDDSGSTIARTVSNGSQLNTDFSSGVAYTDYAGQDSNNYQGGCCFSEFFQNNNIRLVLGGHKHTYSMSHPTVENVTYNGNIRQVVYTSPYVQGINAKPTNLNYVNTVVYCMSQATGFKLESNKDKPGILENSPNENWLYHFYPYSVSTGTLNPGQQYPMCQIITCNNSEVTVNPYAVENVYKHASNGTVTAFDINTQTDSAVIKALENSNTKQGISCKINYSSGDVTYT